MEEVLEPVENSRQIISKLVTEYVQRYQLKQQFQGCQFNSDTHRLISELQLYHRTNLQFATLAPHHTPRIDQKMIESLFRVIQFLAKFAQKLQNQSLKANSLSFSTEMTCSACSMHLNAKKIEVLRRQLFDNVPLLGKEDLEEGPETLRLSEEQSYLLGNEETIKKMSSLQRNLNDKQLGLMRIIDEFQDFRSNLLIGLPKNQQKGFEDKFNTKEYVFQLAQYFSNNLKAIEDKIAHLKSICKRTEDSEVQCHIAECTEEEKERLAQIETMKVTALRAEVEIKRLNELKCRLQDSLKVYSVEIKHLKKQLAEVEEDNKALKQEMFLEKLKLKAKAKAKAKQPHSSQENQGSSKESPRKSLPSGADLEIANEFLNQLSQRKSELLGQGVRIEEAFPFFKSTFKRALDHFISHRGNGSFQRKQLFRIDSECEDLDLAATSKSKVQVKADSASRKQLLAKFETNVSRMQHKNFLKICKNQVNYKIAGNNKKNTRHLSSHEEKYRSPEQAHPKEPGRFLYKRSTLQTEGGNLKKRGLHVKLSSLASEAKEPVSLEGSSQHEVQSNFATTPHYQPVQTDSIKDEDTESLPKTVEQSSDLFSGDKTINSKSKKHLRHMKKGSLTSLVQSQEQKSNFHNLIQIKQIHHKTMTPEVLDHFFHPLSQTAIQIHEHSAREGTVLNNRRKSSGQPSLESDREQSEVRHRRMKQIFKTLNAVGKSGVSESSLEEQSGQGGRRRTKKKETLTIQELSYLTAFFTLMAQAHISNEPLYSQLKICTFEHRKENALPGQEQTMVREVVRDIIVKHRKCSRTQSICQHLADFLIAFNGCLEE